MAVLGGASLGLGLGILGTVLGSQLARLTLVIVAWMASLWYAVMRPSQRLGLDRQVRRRWDPGKSPGRVHAIWGATLGFGLFTAIPYSAWLLVFAVEAVGGPLLGAVCGGMLGLGRQLPLLIIPWTNLNPGETVSLVDRWATSAQRVNLTLVILGGGLIVATVL
jgi:hypothetical protein